MRRGRAAALPRGGEVQSAAGGSRGRELGQWHVGIGEPAVVDGRAGADELLDVLRDVPDVDVHAGDDAVARQPERDELAPGGVAAEDDAVPAAREAGVLHADLVLIGEEVRDALIGLPAAEHVARGGGALLDRVVPVLDPEALAVERMPRARDVPGREDAR